MFPFRCSRNQLGSQIRQYPLVEGTAGRGREEGSTDVQITYRFDPPAQESEVDLFVSAVPNPVGYFSP